MIDDLKQYKDLKKVKIVYKELIEAAKSLTAAMEILQPYVKYIWVQESISIMHNSRTIIEININNYKRVLKL